jgi:DNA repair exonuclease SbcCD ATPase subunit
LGSIEEGSIAMRQEVQTWRDTFTKVRALREVSKKQIEQKKELIAANAAKVKVIEQAQGFFQDMAYKTQSLLKIKIEVVVTSMLNAVFPGQYDFKVEFDTRAGRMEANLAFINKETGKTLDPMSTVGGGVIDAASFALRCSLHVLQSKVAPVLVFDEPFRFVSRDLLPVAVDVVSNLCKELHIQFMMVTHLREFQESADLLYVVTQKEGESEIAEV